MNVENQYREGKTKSLNDWHNDSMLCDKMETNSWNKFVE